MSVGHKDSSSVWSFSGEDNSRRLSFLVEITWPSVRMHNHREGRSEEGGATGGGGTGGEDADGGGAEGEDAEGKASCGD